MNMVTKRRESYILKWGLQTLEMEDFLREREREPREGEEEERSERSGKVFQTEGKEDTTRHDTLWRSFGAKQQSHK